MKTTKKEFAEQVREHIVNRLSEDKYTELPLQLNAVVEGFKNWYVPYEQKRTPNRQAAFIGWLMRLPSELSVEFTNHGVYETLKSWFENCGEPYKEQSSDKELHWYLHFIHREFSNLCKKNGVEF